MKIKYEIEVFEPSSEKLGIKFTASGNDELVDKKMFSPMDFSKDKMMEMIEAYASHIAGKWGRQMLHTKSCPIPMSGEVDVEPEVYIANPVAPQVMPPPEYDPWTQRLELEDVTSPHQTEINHIVIDMTEAEQKAFYEHMVMSLRAERNARLLESDFFNFPDACVGNVQDWLDYRQALRDLPTDPSWPKNVLWPTRPDVVKETH